MSCWAGLSKSNKIHQDNLPSSTLEFIPSTFSTLGHRIHACLLLHCIWDFSFEEGLLLHTNFQAEIGQGQGQDGTQLDNHLQKKAIYVKLMDNIERYILGLGVGPTSTAFRDERKELPRKPSRILFVLYPYARRRTILFSHN